MSKCKSYLLRYENFLNASNGSKTFRCLAHTDATKEKLRWRKCSDETRKKMREGCKRRPALSLEARIKISESRKGKVLSVTHRKAISQGAENRQPISEETRLKMRASSVGRSVTEDVKEKLRIHNTGKTASAKTRQKMSDLHKNRKWWNDGVVSKFCKEKPEGEQWISGRHHIPKKVLT